MGKIHFVIVIIQIYQEQFGISKDELAALLKKLMNLFSTTVKPSNNDLKIQNAVILFIKEIILISQEQLEISITYNGKR